MSKQQKEIFLKDEGDRWYDRNISKIKETGVWLNRPEIKNLSNFLKPEQKILEIGCSGGYHAPYFESLGVSYYGLDPSQNAIAAAKENFKKGHFEIGTADILPFADDTFEMVFFGFCLYLIDRKHLTKVVCEADRVLKNRGFLSILDFQAATPLKRPYSHTSGVTTYKMDYGLLFQGFPQYSICHKSVGSMSGQEYPEDFQDRVSLTVLYKDLNQGYLDCP